MKRTELISSLARSNKTLHISESIGAVLEVEKEECKTAEHNFEVRPGTSGNVNPLFESKIVKRTISSTLFNDSDSDSSLGFGYDSDKDREYIPDHHDESDDESCDENRPMKPNLKRIKTCRPTIMKNNRPTHTNVKGQQSNSDCSIGLNMVCCADAQIESLEDRPTVSNVDLAQTSTPVSTPDEQDKSLGKVRSRWRKATPSNWKTNINKTKKKSGLPYLSKKGKMMVAKKPKNIDCSRCFYKCTDHFTEEDRQQICQEYTAADYERQKDFILARVKQCDVERKRKRKEPGLADTRSEKTFSYVYTFLKNDEDKRVCKNFFLSTLSISNGPLKTAFSSKSNVSGTFTGKDKRGHKKPPNKTSEFWIQKIKEHIESFVAMESHYSRKDSTKLYLDTTLSIKKMYELFQNLHENEAIPSEGVYRSIFCTQYNMSFFTPSKDKCLICKRYEEAKEEEKALLKTDYEAHIKRKEEANASKEEDKKRANNDNSFVSASFDLQKVLQIPVSDAGPVYYSRKLCVYNLTIYESALPNKAYCYAWNECNGKRGSSEIGTCLLEWFKSLPDYVKAVSLFSDTCGGQNRNQFMAALLLYIVQTYPIEIIEHKFLESGHTKMEVDSMHAAIEFAQKNVPPIVCLSG